MIREQVVESPILAHGDASPTGVVIFGDDSIRHLVMSAHEVGRCRTEIGGQDGFHAPAVAVVGELGVEKKLNQSLHSSQLILLSNFQPTPNSLEKIRHCSNQVY